MAVYIVNYDLCQPGRNYEQLFGALRAYGTYCKCLKSTWLIVTTKTAFQVAEHLRGFIDANDQLFVAQCNKDWGSYGMTDETINWLRRQM